MTDTGCILASPIPEDPGLSITKTASAQGGSTVGDVITYQVTVSNTSDGTLLNVTVDDPQVQLIPAGPITLNPTTAFVAEGDYTITLDDVAAGRIVNVATVTAVDNGGNTITAQSPPVTTAIEAPPEDP